MKKSFLGILALMNFAFFAVAKPIIIKGYIANNKGDTLSLLAWKGSHIMSTNDVELRSEYAFDGYPQYVIIDKNGIIRNSDASRENDILKKEIEKLLKE